MSDKEKVEEILEIARAYLYDEIDNDYEFCSFMQIRMDRIIELCENILEENE